MVKTILNNKNIDYEYKLLSELSNEDQSRYLEMCKKANQKSFPLIIKENKLISIQEV